MALPDEPYTRVERYLARLSGQNVDIPEYPITRIECYLDYLCENGGGVPNPNAGTHNAIFRGADLGGSLTDAQLDAIDAGTFDDIYIGDYWKVSGRIYRVAGLDYFYRMGDTSLTTHHVVLVPDTPMTNQTKMNETATTEGGYAGCSLRSTILPTILETFKTAFGDDHILTRRTRLVTTVSGGVPTASAWTDSRIELLNESMVIGRGAFGTHDGNGYNIGEKLTQLPLFALEPQYCHNRGNVWLQDVVSATAFAYMSNYGLAFQASANVALGARPYVCIGKVPPSP